MILFPAIDLHEGRCVRLFQGDYATAEIVADHALATARRFQEAGAHWLHMVDLDGAKAGKPQNAEQILEVAKKTSLSVEVGGGIRNMAAVERYLEHGVARVILGSAALSDPAFVKAAVQRYGSRIAVGIDSRDGKAAVSGWLETSEVEAVDLARRMERLGVETLICTDIATDGAMTGPNLSLLQQLDRAVSCRVIASGGVSSLEDVRALRRLGLYGAITGRAVYHGALDLPDALAEAHRLSSVQLEQPDVLRMELARYFEKAALVPAIVQEAATGQVLMLAYMDRQALVKTLETGETWFFSRSRQALWHKGESSGHFQRVLSITADCDDDTLLLQVEQTGAACHTGKHSCFFKPLLPEKEE